MAKKSNLLKENKSYIQKLFQTFHTTSPKKNNKMIACGKIYGSVQERIIESTCYFEFMFECDRQENSSDIIHVIIEKNPQTSSLRFANAGTELTLIGYLRSINWHDTSGKRHLDVIMQAIDFEFHTIYTDKNFDKNITILSGYVCTKPTFKITGTNRQIAEFRIAVRNDQDEDAYYFPIIAWGNKAIEAAQQYKVGDKLTLLGRVQSRIYYKKISETDGEHRIAYEISSRYMTRQKNIPSRNRTCN